MILGREEPEFGLGAKGGAGTALRSLSLSTGCLRATLNPFDQPLGPRAVSERTKETEWSIPQGKRVLSFLLHIGTARTAGGSGHLGPGQELLAQEVFVIYN